MSTPRLGLVVEDKPTELSCTFSELIIFINSCSPEYLSP